MLELLTQDWAQTVIALYVLLTVVVRFTPTEKDNQLLGTFGKVLDQIVPGGVTKGLNK